LLFLELVKTSYPDLKILELEQAVRKILSFRELRNSNGWMIEFLVQSKNLLSKYC